MKSIPLELKRKKFDISSYPIEGGSIEEAKRLFFKRKGKVEKQPPQVDPDVGFNPVKSSRDRSGYSSTRDRFNGVY